MTREEARAKAEIMLAYADGKTIQHGEPGENDWEDMTDGVPSFSDKTERYRIKPEPKFIPYTYEDAPFLLGRKVKSHKHFGIIVHVDKAGFQAGQVFYCFERLNSVDLIDITDGTEKPFGKECVE